MLEGPRIGHDRAVEVEESVDPALLGDLPERRAPPGDVRRGDHRSETEGFPHPTWGGGLPCRVRVDDRKERGSLDRAVGCGEPPETGETVPLDQFEIGHRCGRDGPEGITVPPPEEELTGPSSGAFRPRYPSRIRSSRSIISVRVSLPVLVFWGLGW